MDAIVLLLSKFSDELLALQSSFVFGVLALSLYWFLLRRHERRRTEWVPAILVREYLDRVDSDEREIRYKLFGEQGVASPSVSGVNASAQDPGILRELEALRAQLGIADKRTMEFDKTLATLTAEKAALEAKLKNMPAAGAATGASSAELDAIQKERDELKAKLAEYEVIEDDLANLKKFQTENKALKEKLEAYEKGSPAPAAAPALSIVPDAAPAPAPVAAAPAGEKTAKQKEDELLSEFEKMLAS